MQRSGQVSIRLSGAGVNACEADGSGCLPCRAKPDGAFYIRGSEMEPHLVLMPVSDLPGVGWSLSHRLTGLGISTVADLRERSSAALQRELGVKTGQTLWNFAHGR